MLVVTFLLSLGTGVFWNAIGFVAKHGYGFSQERTLVLYASDHGWSDPAAAAACSISKTRPMRPGSGVRSCAL